MLARERPVVGSIPDTGTRRNGIQQNLHRVE
jgi:hypothetical protein